jgi:Zn-dependent metalloprotease
MICSVVPPHILEHIAAGGDPEHRDAALRTLSLTGRLMGRREVQGAMLPLAEAQAGQEYRQVFDARGFEQLPGRLVWREGMDPGARDQEVAEAARWADATFQLYLQAFKRLSVDGRGMRLLGTVHYSRRYMNAFWDGRQMVYGDGDGRLFNRFTASSDVVGHEMTHGVTQYTAQLVYQGQPGALNESISDCFGSMVKQHALKQNVDQADWLIGAELLARGVKGRGLRDMVNPGTAYDDPNLGRDPQPGHMSRYVQTREDNGGVHINSGIPNRAFALAARAIGGNSWEGAGQVWYRTLLTLGNPQADFSYFARQTVRAAGDLFGQGSKQQQAVEAAWSEVGVT